MGSQADGLTERPLSLDEVERVGDRLRRFGWPVPPPVAYGFPPDLLLRVQIPETAEAAQWWRELLLVNFRFERRSYRPWLVVGATDVHLEFADARSQRRAEQARSAWMQDPYQSTQPFPPDSTIVTPRWCRRRGMPEVLAHEIDRLLRSEPDTP